MFDFNMWLAVLKPQLCSLVRLRLKRFHPSRAPLLNYVSPLQSPEANGKIKIALDWVYLCEESFFSVHNTLCFPAEVCLHEAGGWGMAVAVRGAVTLALCELLISAEPHWYDVWGGTGKAVPVLASCRVGVRKGWLRAGGGASFPKQEAEHLLLAPGAQAGSPRGPCEDNWSCTH